MSIRDLPKAELNTMASALARGYFQAYGIGHSHQKDYIWLKLDESGSKPAPGAKFVWYYFCDERSPVIQGMAKAKDPRWVQLPDGSWAIPNDRPNKTFSPAEVRAYFSE